MHHEILNKEQLELLPLVRKFRKKFYLVGGTAIALQLGHRRSIDFDLFTEKGFSKIKILSEISSHTGYNPHILFQNTDQIHCIINDVKLTFFLYPFKIKPTVAFDDVIMMPSLETLAAMKAFALGGRAKWKDYVDLYFLLKLKFSVEDVCRFTEEIFPEGTFSTKLFRQQLSYFNDIDYSEKVEFLSGFEVPDEEVKNFLIQQAIQKF